VIREDPVARLVLDPIDPRSRSREGDTAHRIAHERSTMSVAASTSAFAGKAIVQKITASKSVKANTVVKASANKVRARDRLRDCLIRARSRWCLFSFASRRCARPAARDARE
jgi:hypothetical protein